MRQMAMFRGADHHFDDGILLRNIGSSGTDKSSATFLALRFRSPVLSPSSEVISSRQQTGLLTDCEKSTPIDMMLRMDHDPR